MSGKRYVDLDTTILAELGGCRISASSMELRSRIEGPYGPIGERTFYRRLQSLLRRGLIVVEYFEPHGFRPRAYYLVAPKTVSPSR
jgi:DNA-binding PadR family transcriptional regulator